MPDTTLTFRFGASGPNPTIEDEWRALNELVETDPEHPDCWLSDAQGGTLAAHESGNIILENVETGEGPWQMPGKSHEAILPLWQLLAASDLASIRQQPWIDGYGR